MDGATKKATLYLPNRNEGREKGEGKVLSAEDAEEVKKLTGVDAVASTDVLAEQIQNRYARAGKRILYTPLAPAEGGAMSRDLALRFVADAASDPFDGRPSREGHFTRCCTSGSRIFEIKDLSPTLDALRLIKSEREMAMIRKATKLAGLAILEGMRSTRPGQYERELDAVAKFVFYRNGAQGDAYFSLIGSGPNAYWPHYNAGKRKMQDGDFLLFDYAPDYGYYMADVTRMYPVNGKFSTVAARALRFLPRLLSRNSEGDRSRQDRDGDHPRGRRRDGPDPRRREVLEALAPQGRRGLRREATRRAAKANIPYIGHWVGMATHDVGPHTARSKPGMVFTIEPALTVPDEKIYVRLEDMIFIHANGAEVVSTDAPWDIDAIEKAMKEDGMLEKYPRVYPPAEK